MHPPYEALLADSARLPSETVTALLPAVTLGQVLWRGARALAADRLALVAVGLEELAAHTLSSSTPHDAQATAASTAREELERYVAAAMRGNAGPLLADQAAASLQSLVGELERRGAFSLSASLLEYALPTIPHLSQRARALLLMQSGRVARQSGRLHDAQTIYSDALSMARRAKAPDVTTRAVLGLGVLASMRGNYPEARSRFRQAIRLARRADDAALTRMAHQGLLSAALAAGDADTALVHGWEAAKTAPTPEARAEDLVNLSEVCRAAGRLRAALRGYLTALELTDLPRLRLGALGGGALVAAQLGERQLVDHLSRLAERDVARSAQPYENAVTYVELAEAYALLNDLGAVDKYRTVAAALAAAGAFHEVTHRVDALPRASSVVAPDDAAPSPTHAPASQSLTPLTTRSRRVVTALESMTAAASLGPAQIQGRMG